MAGMRRGDRARFSAIIWPGFVDAMAGLLMIVMFVLTVFVVVQSVMRDRITSQDERLDQLGAQVAQLSGALGLAQAEGADLRDQLATEAEAREAEARAAAAQRAEAEAAAQAAAHLIASQRTEIDEGAEAARLAAARREALEALIADLRRRNADAGAQAQTLASQLAGAQAIGADLGTRLAASETARSDLTDQLARAQAQGADLTAQRDAAQRQADALSQDLAGARAQAQALATDLDAEAAARLVEAAAAQALRARLADAEATLSTRDLALEEARREAEATLTLLAAAEAARDKAQEAIRDLQSAAEDEAARQAALLSLAQRELSQQEALSAEGQRQVAALNAQVRDLRQRLGQLQSVLDLTSEQGAEAELRIEDLGAQLNAALLEAAAQETARAQAEAARAEAQSARAQAESDRAEAETARAEAEAARAEAETARAEIEAEARARAEAEAKDLARYRSEFFGQLSTILKGREGVEVVGDRFVFSSEVLFSPGEAVLSPEGRDQIRAVTELLDSIGGQIPAGIDWVIRVDGHTDDQPLSGTGRYRDNWELSQARALAVVRFMVDDLGFAPDRLVAAGFGEFRPAMAGDSPQARAANRRIELKLTER